MLSGAKWAPRRGLELVQGMELGELGWLTAAGRRPGHDWRLWKEPRCREGPVCRCCHAPSALLGVCRECGGLVFAMSRGKVYLKQLVLAAVRWLLGRRVTTGIQQTRCTCQARAWGPFCEDCGMKVMCVYFWRIANS